MDGPSAYKRFNGLSGQIQVDFLFKDEHFLGAAWKAMPADLSLPFLGKRVLDLMDDMNNWGDRKQVLAEADLFTIEPENEMCAPQRELPENG